MYQTLYSLQLIVKPTIFLAGLNCIVSNTGRNMEYDGSTERGKNENQYSGVKC